MQQFSVHSQTFLFVHAVPFNLCPIKNVIYFYVKGHWHQYDDIVCTEPSKTLLKRLKNAFWSEQRTSVVQGKEIAGNIMLDSIFDLLRIWNDINLKRFLIQLNQFFDIYANPFVYEDKLKKWNALEYGEKEVWKLLQLYHYKKSYQGLFLT